MQCNFYDVLVGICIVFIFECKKVLLLKGLICEDFDLVVIVSIYKYYVLVILVLCDEKYFQGSFDFLLIVSQVVLQLILCKDFIIDFYQIYLVCYYQVDVCLLMFLVFDDEQYCQFLVVVYSLNMGVLIEVSNEEELECVIVLKVKVVGINNCDLCDMLIDFNCICQLVVCFGLDVMVISEFGIYIYVEVCELSYFVNGFLIGFVLMEQVDLEVVVKCVLFGENKVCGLMCLQDVQVVWEFGVIYGGLIFVLILL